VSLNIALHSPPQSPNSFIPFQLRSTILNTFLFSHMHVTCSSHLILLHMITKILFGENIRNDKIETSLLEFCAVL
jgi:hypothetical protein